MKTDPLPTPPKPVAAVEPRRVIEIEPHTESHGEPLPKVEHPQLQERTDAVRWVMRCARDVVQRPVAPLAADSKPVVPPSKPPETVVETACRIVRQVLETIERTPPLPQPARPTPTAPTRSERTSRVTEQPAPEPQPPTMEPKPIPVPTTPPKRYVPVQAPAPAATADAGPVDDQPDATPKPATEQPQPRPVMPGPDIEPLPAPRVVAEALAVLVSRVRRTVAGANALTQPDETSPEHAALGQLDVLIASLRAPNADPLSRAAELSDALRWLLAASQLQTRKAAATLTPIQRDPQTKRCQRCGSALRRRASGELICPRCG